MTAEEIIRFSRRQLDDLAEPYLWEDVELVNYLNLSLNELCEKTNLIRDLTTTAITRIKLLSHQGKYTLDKRVVSIKGARIPNRETPLVLRTEDTMDKYHSDWRNQDTIDFTGITYVVPAIENNSIQTVWFVPIPYDGTGEVKGNSNLSFRSNGTITTTAVTLSDEFDAGDEIYVSGSTSNDGYYTISSVTASDIFVTGTLVEETNTSAIVRTVETTAELTVVRYPLTEFTIDDLNDEPEIPYTYHARLVDGILMTAYEKEDADTYDQKKADRARARFYKTIDDMKRLFIRKYHAPGAVEVHKGAI